MTLNCDQLRRRRLLSVSAVYSDLALDSRICTWFSAASGRAGKIGRCAGSVAARRRHPDVEVAIALEVVGLHVDEVCCHAQVRHQLALDAAAAWMARGFLKSLSTAMTLTP